MKFNTIVINKHENLSTQRWFGTSCDSQMFFKETWYSLPKNILNKYFEIGINGGSQSLNFNSSDLDTILELFDIQEVKYTKKENIGLGIPNTIDISKIEYLSTEVVQEKDDFNEYLMNNGLGA